MNKCWARNRHLHLSVRRELLKSVIKPSLTSGLQALTIVDTGLKPLEKFQDKALRRSCSQRKRSSVILLEMILQITPLRCDYHLSVLSLLHNIWTNPGPCSDLLLHLLRDQTLKDLYWPHNVTRILTKYNLPDAEFILTREPVTKITFKNFVKARVISHHAATSETRIMRSNLYRFIFAGDFSLERKKLHPILTTAHTRRQTLSLKLILYHLCMEYPNAENLSRIRVKKSKLCAICEDEGVSCIDSTEHNLFSCVCVTRDSAESTMRDAVYETVSRIKNLNSVRHIANSDIQQATLLFLNPCSSGISENLRLDPKYENIMFLCKLLGKYVLHVHNLRTKNGGDLSEKQGGGKPSLRIGSKGGPAQSKRPKCAHSQSKKNLKRITDFFKSNKVTNSDHLEQLGLTRGQTRALENLSWNWNVLGTVVAPKITLFSTMMTSPFGKREIFRNAEIKHTCNQGVIKTICFHTDDTAIAKSIMTITVNSFDANMVSTLAELGRFHVKVPGEADHPQQRTPVTFICTKEPTPIKIEVLEEFDEYLGLVLSDDRYRRSPAMKEEDEEELKVRGQLLGRSILCKNMENWASKWFDRNEWEVSFNTESHSWPDSAWQRVMMYLEYNKPGTAIYCSGKAEGNWPMSTVAQITKKTPSGQFVYRCNIGDHFKSMFNSDIPTTENSEWFMMNQSVLANFGIEEGDCITKMSDQMSELMKDKHKAEIEIENLRVTTRVLAAHNQEILRHVSNYACADDVERKDGQRRRVKFTTLDESDYEGDIEEQATMIKTIIQNVVKPGDLRQGTGSTTVDMKDDLRMKIIAAKTARPKTVVSPTDQGLGLGPDIDENPEVKKEAPPVVTLQGLEGAVVRRPGATRGIITSLSSNSSETEMTLEERRKQVPNIARGRALARKAGVTQSLRTIAPGTGRGAGRGAGRGQPQVGGPKVNNQPRHQALIDKIEAKAEDSAPRSPVYSNILSPTYSPAYSPVYSPYYPKGDSRQPRNKAAKLEKSVFVKEDEAASTKPLPKSEGGATSILGINRAKDGAIKKEEMSDPYSLKQPMKGEPAKPAKAKSDTTAEAEDEKMDVSTLREEAEENDAVSETNLSDVQYVEEYPEVEVAKTEKILEKMGTASSPGVVELCDDIVLMLSHNTVTSTPKRSSRSASSTSSSSTHSSMPPLGDGWSGTSDSGNISDAPPNLAVTASDTVKVNSEAWKTYIYIMTMTDFLCSRTLPPHRSKPMEGQMSDLSMICTILQKAFIIYYLSCELIITRITSVASISRASMLRKSLLSQ